METTGRLKDVSRNWQTDRLLITFEIETEPRDEINTIWNEERLSITARKYRKGRSINANSYFHVLAAKIAGKTGSTLTHEKNRLIREYGQWEYIDGMIPTITMKAVFEDQVLDMESIHVKVISRDADTVRFGLMRGSHTYDTAEMSRLIDGTVTECKELRIETLPPEELMRMVQSWHG